MFLVRSIPNALTCCNLLCGCVGLVMLFNGSEIPAAWFIWAACIFDFLDGFAARLLKVSSPIGKELDSLADMVTFGVLPAMTMYLTMQPLNGSLAWVAFLLAVASALRLAKFNIDERQNEGFIGLPTPANALFISSVPLFFNAFPALGQPGLYLQLGIVVLFSWLMVSPIPLFALKFKSFGWKGNEIRFTFLALSVLLIAFLREAAIPVIIITYVLMSLFSGWRRAGD